MLKNRDVIGRTNMENYNYGLMIYTTTNIGDEIQSIAASRFLPSIDEYISRENIKFFKPKHSQKLTKVIMNAWWMWKPKNFPPSKFIIPLLISMHIQTKIRKNFLTRQTKEYLIKNGPVGCRDMNTYNFLIENNIPAYFSGCLTLTLTRNPKIKRENYILCIDVPSEIVEIIKKRTTKKVYDLTALLSPYYLPKQRLKVAKLYLRILHSAHCVVTTRLHATLPSLALETPVLRIVPNDYGNDIKGRTEGLENLAYTVTEEEIINNTNSYNFDNPPENKKDYLDIRNNLIERCKEFTGYDSNNPILDEDCDALVELFQLSANSIEQTRRMLYFTHNSDLFKTFINKVFFGINRHNYLDR